MALQYKRTNSRFRPPSFFLPRCSPLLPTFFVFLPPYFFRTLLQAWQYAYKRRQSPMLLPNNRPGADIGLLIEGWLRGSVVEQQPGPNLKEIFSVKARLQRMN